MSDPRPDPVQKLLGAAAMLVGGLIATLCGTCTLLFAGSTLISTFRYPGSLDNILTVFMGGSLLLAIVGGLPTVLGLVILRWGWRRYHPPPSVKPADIAAFSDDLDGTL